MLAKCELQSIDYCWNTQDDRLFDSGVCWYLLELEVSKLARECHFVSWLVSQQDSHSGSGGARALVEFVRE